MSLSKYTVSRFGFALLCGFALSLVIGLDMETAWAAPQDDQPGACSEAQPEVEPVVEEVGPSNPEGIEDESGNAQGETSGADGQDGSGQVSEEPWVPLGPDDPQGASGDLDAGSSRQEVPDAEDGMQPAPSEISPDLEDGSGAKVSEQPLDGIAEPAPSIESSPMDAADKPASQEGILPDGIYAITANGDSSFRADVAAGGVANGTEVVLWAADYSAKQAFRFTRTADGFYTIQMVHSGKVLASTSFSSENGAQVVEWDDNGTANMLWIISLDAEGCVTIACKANGLVLDYASNVARPGASLVLWEKTGAAKQRFWLETTNIPESSERVLEDGVYEIVSARDPEYVVSVSGIETSNGSQAVLWQDNGSCNQKFCAVYSEGYYILSVVSGPVLSVTSLGSASGTDAVQWEDNSTANQRWALVPMGDGEYAIVSAANGLWLDFASNVAHNGASLVVWEETGSRKQLFRFVRTTAASNGYFALLPEGNESLAISVNGGSLASGVQPILWSYAGTLDQKYQVIVNDDGSCMFKSLQSGLILSRVEDSDKVVQLDRAECADQNWLLKPTGAGVFSLVALSSNGSWCLQISGPLASSAPVVVGSPDSTAHRMFRIVPVSLLERGWYTISSAASDQIKISLAQGDSSMGLEILARYENGRSWQKFYVETSGFDECQIRSLYSDYYLAAEGLSPSNGASVIQWENNGTGNMLWTAVPSFDGFVSFAVQSSGKRLDVAGNAVSSGAPMVVWEATGSDKQKFALRATSYECVLRDWQWAIGQASSGFSLFNSDIYLSDAVYGRLVDAIDGFTGSGASVGFLMMDLTTGQGLSYAADGAYFGASTVKGPYVVSACKYSDLSAGSGLAYNAIVWSDNDAYNALRAQHGNWCFSRFCDDALTSYDRYSQWPFASARELASLWVTMYDYFTSDIGQSAEVADLFTHSDVSSIKRSLGGLATVYSKPGWMSAYEWSGPIYNDAGVVVVGDRPYVLAVTSSGDWTRSGQMDDLVLALDGVHSEMVGWS